MYYQNYEEYMRSILGYPSREQNKFSDTYRDYPNMINYNYFGQLPRYSSEILDLYPEIYKIVNPMVCKVCEANTKPISRELIEQMVDEIYLNIESDPEEYGGEVINVRVNLPDINSKQEDKRQNKNNQSNSNSMTLSRMKDNRIEKRQEKLEKELAVDNSIKQNRQVRRNNTLRDLIKILILNQLLGGNMRPPRTRPPYPRPGEIRAPYSRISENIGINQFWNGKNFKDM